MLANRAKGRAPRQAANSAAFSRSWHTFSSSLFRVGTGSTPAKTLSTVYSLRTPPSIDLARLARPDFILPLPSCSSIRRVHGLLRGGGAVPRRCSIFRFRRGYGAGFRSSRPFPCVRLGCSSPLRGLFRHDLAFRFLRFYLTYVINISISRYCHMSITRVKKAAPLSGSVCIE